MKEHQYHRLTVEGDKKTKWICGCYQTEDDFFKFCPQHNDALKKTILAQIDELDLTLAVTEKSEI